MLSDIPYKNIMNTGRKYDVWVLRDVYGNTFPDIAKEYGVSVGTIVDNYYKILRLKARYYVNHLSIVHGYKIQHISEKYGVAHMNVTTVRNM